jgi:hypothetical protein
LLFDISESTNPLQKTFNPISKDSHFSFVDSDRFVEITPEHRIIFHNVRASETTLKQAMQAQGENLLVSKQTSQFRRKKDLAKDEAQYHSFDPERGVGAWKEIFGTSLSHSLTSMADCYGVFMDNFILKATKVQQPSSEQVEQKDDKKRWASEKIKTESENAEDDSFSELSELIQSLSKSIKIA